MKRHALQILSDDPGTYRWVVMEPTDDALAFEPHSHAECDYPDYESALNAGTLALAAADGEAYENEAADPVGEGDCGAVADLPPT
ncbi:hypothetical protein [Xylophilus sp. GOD-11R]|uniref:hypothetical protein n=1 Tax=Xylophilus sp. GOD-11R TaxID=3089814 RepID=UPI00298C9E37|nr:hypothetical protein [Xylophilus sp. GOD-11R]WPB58664.1 hypothetical protein R9X41_08510 [Xylophilus sp. GOD-11R]